MADELRAEIEKAIEQVEKATPAPSPAAASPAPSAAPVAASPTPSETKETTPPVEAKPAEESAAPAVEAKAEKKEIPPAPKPGEYLAPKAWKAAPKAKWDGLDPEIKAEVSRRESEMTRAFGENSQAREFHKAFYEAVRPYEARIASYGITPVQMVGELLKADYILATAPMHQRASYMAKLINDYGVDIKSLDAALAGEEPADPVTARVETLLQQRLQPLQQFLDGQTRQAEQGNRKLQQEAQTTIEQMAQDVEKFPYFEEVRNDMADLIEFQAQRDVYITPAQAYERCVMMNPELQAQEVARRTTQAQRSAASASNAKAQQALNASVSVSSSPGGVPTKGNGAGSLRDDLEAAVAHIEGR